MHVLRSAMTTLGILLLSGAYYSCKPPQAEKSPPSIPATQSTSAFLAGTLEKLLDSSLTTDTIEYGSQQPEPFVFFKSGNFLSKNERYALFFCAPRDSTYLVKLYSLQDNTWHLKDSIEGYALGQLYFHAAYDDYNFDGQTDIYIQESASNGYVLSRGLLLTIDGEHKKITPHIETRNLANMRPDPATKTVISEEYISCNHPDGSNVCTVTSKWLDDVLEPIKKQCNCP